MKQYHYQDIDALQELVSDQFGEWGHQTEITQDLINQFAEMTGDDYWIHTDPEKAKTDSPFGCTIAHGFLTLALLPKIQTEPVFEIIGFNNLLNYGSNKLRFTGAVPVGSKIHARCKVLAIEATKKGTQVILEQHIHIVGQDERPVLVYEMMYIYM